MTLPSLSESKREWFIDTSVTVSNIQITTFDFNTDQIFINFLSNSNGVSNGIGILINDFNIIVDADCHYSAVVSDSGHLKASSYSSFFIK